LPLHSMTYQNMAVGYMDMGDTDAAISLINELLRKHDRYAAPYYQAICYLNLATAYFEDGSFDQALLLADEALKLRATFPSDEHGAALAIRGLVAAERGDWDTAEDFAEQTTAISVRWGDGSYAAALQARVLVRKGSEQRALAVIREAIARTQVTYVPAS